MKKFIENNANSKNILLLFLLFLLFNFVLFPSFLRKEGNAEALDLQFAYSAQKAYQLIENYGDAGRKSYIIGELTVDLIYPIIYSLLLSFIIYAILRNPKLALFPFLILITDYFENFGIVTMLYCYPQKLIYLAWITSFFSTLKWTLVIFSISIIIYGSIKRLGHLK